MKILQLKFQNINSLKGEHAINFEEEPLKSNSLFAITGPTGSGKSTLLDVISLALFNQVPRMDKISKSELSKTGAVITRHQKNAYAEVIYQCSAGKYLSHWDIQYNRNHNLNDYEMRLKNLDTNEELDLKKSEVPTQNEILIGLTYTQFIKSIVLAQGEFAKFLKADDSERKQLLEQITGTDIYRRIGMLAYQKANVISNEIDKDKQRIKDIKEELIAKEESKTKQESLSLKKEEKIKLETQKNKLTQQEELFKNASKIADELTYITQQKQETATKVKNFEEANALKIKQHLKTQGFVTDLQNWQNTTQQYTTLAKKLHELKKQEQELVQLKENLLNSANNILKSNVTWEIITKKLEDFRVFINALQQQLKEVRSAYTIEFSHLQQQVNTAGVQFLAKDIKGIETELKLKQTNWKIELEEIENYLVTFSFKETSTASRELEISSLITNAVEAKTRQDQHQKWIEKESKLCKEVLLFSEETERLAPLVNEKKLNYKNVQLEVEKLHLQLNNYNLTVALAVHRSDLKEGEACPLCGASSHPFATHIIDDNKKIELERNISLKKESEKKQEKEFRLTDKELDKLNNQLSTAKKLVAEAREELVTSNKYLKTLDKRLLQFKNEDAWEVCIFNLNELKNKLQQKISVQSLLEKSVSWVLVVSKIKASLEQGTTLKAKKDVLYLGDDSDSQINALKSQIDKASEKESNTKNQLKETTEDERELKNSLKEVEHKLNIKISEAKFASIEEALNSRIKEDIFQELLEHKRMLERQTEALKHQENSIQKQQQEIKKTLTYISPIQLNEDKAIVNKALMNIEEEISVLARVLHNQKEKVEKIKGIQQRIEKLSSKNEKWLLLNEVIGDYKGKRFNDFAQDLSLKYLLNIANKRLAQLSMRYQIDRPTEEETKDLMIIDNDMGSERRSVKTLSGGETFVVSLALALALSDMASQNVSINSLFIDEGFGTLDPETLDQTLDTLERLQAETNKTIGIISHVDALKERIQTQIQLQKNGQGYSTLRVVSS